jgi:hypothetical protein
VVSPPRTRLYGLPLTGVGTGDVESLTSYLQRLAAAHNMSPRALLRLEFFPIEHTRLDAFRFNGIGKVSGELVDVIEAKTGVSVRHAVMNRFESLIPNRHVVRQDKGAYCPLCVREGPDVESVHGRLTWELTIVTACPRHGVFLHPRRCGAPASRHLDPRNRPMLPGVCGTCGSVGFGCNTAVVEATPEALWIGREAERLVALSDSDVRALVPSGLISGVADVVRQRHGGMPVRAALAAGLARASVLTWLQEKARPSLGALTRFALAAQANVVEMLRGRFVESPCRQRSVITPRRRASHDWDEVRSAILDAIALEKSPSLTSFAKKMGVDLSHLRRTLPKESSILVERMAASRDQARRCQYERALAAYAEAARALVAEGRAVRRKSLQTRSGLHVFFRHRERRRALETVLREQKPAQPED